MKKLFTLILLVTACRTFSQVTYTWTSLLGVGALASNPLNWSPAAIPQSSDNVVFNGSGTVNCLWDLAAINSFSMLSGYTGNVTVTSLSGIVINGDLVINAGSMTAACDINFAGIGSGNFILGAAGTFNNTGGSVTMGTQAGQVFTFSGNIVIETFILTGGAGTTKRDINFGSNLTATDVVISTGLIVATSKIHSFQGTLHIKNSLDVSGSAYTSVPSGNTANFIFDGSSATLVGASAALRVPLPNIQINTSGTQAMSGFLNLYGNWTGTSGTLSLGTSTVNMYGASATITGTAAAFDNLMVQNTASVSFPASTQVMIGGNFTNSGTVTIPATNVLYLNGTGTQSVSGNGFTAGSIRAGSGTRTIVLNAAVSISDSLKVENNVTFAAGNNLTIKSGSALKGRVAQIGTGASVTGSVTVETFIPGGSTGWANLGVSGVNGQTIANWDTYSTSGGANGIPMTCGGCVYPQTATSYWFNSIAAWNEPLQDYDTTIVSSSALTPGKGFWIYVGNSQLTSSDLKLINTGSLVQGTVTIPLTSTSGTNGAQGMNLVANPYASPIGWSKVLAASGGTSTGLSNAIYIWNADIGVTTSYVSGVSSHGAGAQNIIPAGQGFYVETTAATNLVFTEGVKMNANTSANPLLRSSAASQASGDGQAFHLKLSGSSDWDETAFRIHPEASPLFDVAWDARKIFQSPGYEGYPGPYTKYTTISSRDAAGEDYSIYSLPPLTQSVSIPLLVKVSASGTYTIEAVETESLNDCVMLKDNLLNVSHDLSAGNYKFSISDTTSAPRFELILCRDASEPVGITSRNTSNTILISQDAQGAFVKTVFPNTTKATISAYNIMGQKLMEDIQVSGTETLTHLNLDTHNQVVLIRVVTDKESTAKKLIMH